MTPGEAGAAARPGPVVSWLAVALLTLGLTALTTAQAFEQYRALRTGWSWDLAYYNQWYWALTQGDGVISVRPLASYAIEGPAVWKMNYLSPLRWALAPVYWLAPGPLTLLAVDNVIFWWVIPASYTLARAETGSRGEALAAVALVPLTPLLWPLAWNDFRELQMALPFVLWAFQGVRGRQPRLTGFGVGGILACRQEFAMIVATLAVVPPRGPEDVERTYRWARTLILGAMSWFLFGFLGYLKLVCGGNTPALYLAQFGSRGPWKPEFLRTAGEFLFLGLGAWGALLALSPRLALVVLYWVHERSSGGWALRYLATDEWHHVRYVVPMVSTGLAAGLIGFSRLAGRLRRLPHGRAGFAAVWLTAALFSSACLVAVVRKTERQPRPIGPDEVRAIWSWIDRVGPEDGVLADYSVSAPLSSRRHLYSYRLTPNQPPGYPRLPSEVKWVFYRNEDGSPEVFVGQGFEVVHRGPFLTVLRRTG